MLCLRIANGSRRAQLACHVLLLLWTGNFTFCVGARPQSLSASLSVLSLTSLGPTVRTGAPPSARNDHGFYGTYKCELVQGGWPVFPEHLCPHDIIIEPILVAIYAISNTHWLGHAHARGIFVQCGFQAQAQHVNLSGHGSVSTRSW